MRAERENSKKFAESFAGKANYDVLLENPDCGNLKTPQLGHALARLSGVRVHGGMGKPIRFRIVHRHEKLALADGGCHHKPARGLAVSGTDPNLFIGF